MKRLLIPLLFLFPSSLVAQDLSIEIPSLPAPIKVSLPDNHDLSKKHPTLFYYHGRGGSPNTKLMRKHAGKQDWIIVGMTYTTSGQTAPSPHDLDTERKVYHAVRSLLIEKHASDPSQLYVSGFSLGGWHSDLMLQAEPTLAGGIIMGAGHAQPAQNALRKYASKKPVHLAIGRSDKNYIFALRGFLHHRKLGAASTLEVWPTLAHAYPLDGSDSIRQWLALRAKSPKELAPVATRELATALERADRLPFFEQWDRLREIKDMPYFPLTPVAWQEKFQKVLATVSAHAEVANEAALYAQHRRLLHQEITDRKFETLRRVNAKYLELSSKFPNTRQSKFLNEDYKRTAEILKNVKITPGERKPAVIPVGPNTRPIVPRNPLIR